MSTVPHLEARAVSASIDSEVLLAPTSLTVTPGTALAIQGRNGSGKTTLLRILSGQLRPTDGQALFDGHPLDERNRGARRAISARIGLPAFARELTAHEHLRFIATTWGRTGSTATDAADATLKSLEIRPLRNRFVNELSSGQTQLLSLATALVRPFDVLVLDEPEQRLDAHRRGLVVAAVRAHIDRGASVVFASHNAEMVNSLADTTVSLGEQ
ncbi:ABC transporter ATP-binding protein [Cryobacterium melibiosiphilum]|uniref:ABC transporter ATP-binding protein n=1 Tax=Cryobacterium melibiosiphilum TaxID=995039 RepID=A0A3A5MBD3_9MICO|nr:ABC transporter ATP-binding protein [Cryobacterium melibiosiphilum]RJT85649.1 ABC transporter ATP-binding protein [Cryobacterium melibiosiphilum]